jgi:methionyl-tRNA formyltransferase
MSGLSVMVLCGPSARHVYFANKLASTGRVVAIVQEAGTHWTAKKVVTTLRPDNLFRKVWRWIRDRKRYAGGKEAAFFFGDSEPLLSPKPRLLTVANINDPAVARLADEVSPDLIAVFGTSLIRGDLLQRGRLGLINLHGGLSPHYRGADCTFWALYNGEPDQIGCTIHFIDRGIDTGQLIAHVRPAVRDGDDELTLFWRAVKDSTAAFMELLGRMEAGQRLGQSQREKGRLYRVRDRQWRHERDLVKELRRGLLRGVSLPPRVTWYAVEGTTAQSADIISKPSHA